jgi:hypothetical protein
MQDIDFDEIDRAVSSVTNQNTRGASVPEAVRSTPREFTPFSAPVPAPVAVEPSPAMRRSSGRFMDVVHPSSDMRPTSSSPVVTRDEPIRSTVPPRVVVAEPEPSSTESNDTGFQWPDTIDTPMPTDTVVPHTENAVIEDDSPLESPFLSGTKIEKRPLGAFSTAEPEVDAAPIEEVDEFAPIMSELQGVQQSTVVVDPEMASVESELPRELHDDLLMLEAHGTPEEEPAAQPAEQQQAIIVQNALATPTSITQQYKEQSSAPEAASGAIYDTEAYHQPLRHTPKKHSSAVAVIWIVTLILVGGGLGLAAYYVFLPMLG